MKKRDLLLTRTCQILFNRKCVYVCLCLFISICTSAQNLVLQRTWSLGRSFDVLKVHKSMAVQKSGDHFAVGYQNESEGTFDLYLHDRSTAMKWRGSFSDPPAVRKLVAVAFSETEEAVYVLVKEGESRPVGRLIKYELAISEGTTRQVPVWSIEIPGN